MSSWTRIATVLLVGLWAAPAPAERVDPTRPPGVVDAALSAPESDGFVLTSIISSREQRSAVINGSRLREGERIGSAEVLRIERGAVLLRTPDGTRRLSFSGLEVKRASAASE